MNKQYCVISHTHWDREWYQSYEMFRMRLCDLMDHLLEILEENENYVFHLDSQTVVLEDYLEIHPKRRSELEKYISNGQIIVGPWYVQNDFYLSSGESTIRNLLIGTEIAQDFGQCGRICYCPDQFGIIGQLPQIMTQFDLKGFVFGRGNTSVTEGADGPVIKSSPPEFYWRGTDGTTVKSVCMIRWYNNAQRFSKDIKKAEALIRLNDKEFDIVSKVPFRLLMNGVDHLEPQEDLFPILAKLNGVLDDANIYQGKLEQYLYQTFDYIEKNNCDVPTFEGELRNGHDLNILQGTLSSRVYLKQQNELCEKLLMNRLEPLYSMLSHNGFGKEYPADYFHYLWKELIKNHAHDSICGCSNDIVHKQMEGRFPKIIQTAEKLIERGMRLAAFHSDAQNISESDYIVVLANTTECRKSDVASVRLNFPKTEEVSGFEVLDKNGNPVDFVLNSLSDKEINVYSPINLPSSIKVDAFDVSFAVKDMLPFSFEYFVIRPNKKAVLKKSEFLPETRTIENDGYKVSVNSDNQLVLTVKGKNIDICDFISFEDTADIGDSYTFKDLQGDTAISSAGKIIKTNVERNSIYETLYLQYEIMLPCCFDGKKRSDNFIPHTINVSVTLSHLNGNIKVAYDFDNKSKDHRLRVRIKTGICSDSTSAMSAFEMVERKIGSFKVKDARGADLPNYGLITISDDGSTAAIYSTGLHEYEQLSCDGDIALTVVRATGGIVGRNNVESGDEWVTPEGQCLRHIEGSFVIAYTESQMSAVKEYNAVRNPILTYFESVDSRKFSGGRVALQDSEVDELFYPDDRYKGEVVVAGNSVTDVENENVIVTAFTQAFHSKETIIRLCNMSKKEQTVSVKLPKGTINANKIYLNEVIKENLFAENGAVQVKLAPAEISTIMFY